jgi:hypothetical protein
MTEPLPPQPPPSRGMIFDLIDRILRWLDKPWKAIALAGLAILVALGWSGWTSRDTITDIWKMSVGKPISNDRKSRILKNLRIETGADIVGLWSLRLGANAMEFGRDWATMGNHGNSIKTTSSNSRSRHSIDTWVG